MSEIQWGRWEPQLTMTHIDGSCGACAFPGPLRDRFGTTVQPGHWGRRITRPSRIAQNQRLRSVREWQPPRPVRTHYAVRCPSCGEQRVYRLRTMVPWMGLTEDPLLYQPPAFDTEHNSTTDEPP